MKKIFIFLISFVFIFTLALSAMVYADAENTSASAQLKIGDYFTLGKYNDKPILWRYVADDENGKLILSDRVICFKEYDRPGKNATGSHSRARSLGNNYWGDSNIRSWLNSFEGAGNVVWECGIPPMSNEFANEKGFLADDNFMQNEKSVIKCVTQKSLLDEIDASLAVGGSAEAWEKFVLGTGSILGGTQSNDSYLINPAENYYDEICFEYISDYVFLMDVKQCWSVHENENILGERYCHAKPTQNALDNYEHGKEMSIDEEAEYYLRTPLGFPRNVNRDTQAGGDAIITDYGDYSRTIYCLGIRPAFYLNEETAVIISGSGTEEEPYVINGKTDNEPADNGDVSSGEAEEEKSSVITVFFNGFEIPFDQLPFIENDRVLVPMRAIFEAFGAKVEWNDTEKSITAVRGTDIIKMQIGNMEIIKNGVVMQSDVAPRIIGDRTFVPLRVISESLDAKVDWNETEQKVIITK